MLEIITQFFERHIAISFHEEATEEKLQAASAALLLEMLHAEEIIVDKKHELILTLLESSFNLTDEQAQGLLAVAEQKRQQATDFFEFTHLINERFSREQKIQLIESLWQIALLDQHLDVDEDYLIDKFARLLLIPRVDVVQAKMKVLD